MENLTNDTPPKNGFLDPPSYGTFSTPLRRQRSVFPVQKSTRQSRPEALLEGSKNFRESVFSGTFSSPHTFCTPPYHGPTLNRNFRQNKGCNFYLGNACQTQMERMTDPDFSGCLKARTQRQHVQTRADASKGKQTQSQMNNSFSEVETSTQAYVQQNDGLLDPHSAAGVTGKCGRATLRWKHSQEKTSKVAGSGVISPSLPPPTWV